MRSVRRHWRGARYFDECGWDERCDGLCEVRWDWEVHPREGLGLLASSGSGAMIERVLIFIAGVLIGIGGIWFVAWWTEREDKP
jgi:hypothetical protein